jgi:LmbE family N-acetylglucosaminyl deacetylase
MKYIFLSPHFDDAIYSCGGFIYDLIINGNEVEIWTICAGNPPVGEISPFAKSLHARWEAQTDVITIRSEEDISACESLNAKPVHFDVPDCIYRKNEEEWLYISEAAIFGDLRAKDQEIIAYMVNQIEAKIGKQEVAIFGPLGIGNHVDHQLTKKIFENVKNSKKGYYPEFPYTRDKSMKEIGYLANSMNTQSFCISERGIEKWSSAIELYASQINSFWKTKKAIREDVSAIIIKMGGQIIYS